MAGPAAPTMGSKWPKKDMKGEIFGLVLFVLFASPFSCSTCSVEMGSTEESPEGRLSSNGLGDGSASLTVRIKIGLRTIYTFCGAIYKICTPPSLSSLYKMARSVGSVVCCICSVILCELLSAQFWCPWIYATRRTSIRTLASLDCTCTRTCMRTCLQIWGETKGHRTQLVIRGESREPNQRWAWDGHVKAGSTELARVSHRWTLVCCPWLTFKLSKVHPQQWENHALHCRLTTWPGIAWAYLLPICRCWFTCDKQFLSQNHVSNFLALHWETWLQLINTHPSGLNCVNCVDYKYYKQS